MATRLEELQARKQNLAQRLKQLEQQEKSLLAAQRKEERKARDHAVYVLGGLFLNAIGGNWKTIDWDKVASYLANENIRNHLLQQGIASKPEPENYKDALSRLKDWEKRLYPCPRCGERIPKASHYCQACGNVLNGDVL